MLQPINEVTKDVGHRFYAVMNAWVAIDVGSGAHLLRSRGYTKAGDTKYVLIVPLRKPAKLFDYAEWNERGRKRVRAWSDAEAIEKANKKLEKILKGGYQQEPASDE